MILRRPLLLIPLVILVAFAALALFGLGREDIGTIPSVRVGKPAPVFALQGLNPENPGLETSDLERGTPTLVNFFASWCAPCIVEAPQLQALAEEHGVVVHGIAFKDSPENIEAFLAEHGDPFRRIGMDPDSRAAVEWGVSGVPETFVVAGDGTILYRHIGEIRSEHVDQILEQLKEGRS